MIKFANLLENNDNFAIIDFNLNSKCDDCKSPCSNSLLNLDFFRNKSTKVIINKSSQNNSNVKIEDQNNFLEQPIKIGSKIGVEFNDLQMLILTFKLYGLPLISMILGMLIFWFLSVKFQLNTETMGLLGLCVGFLISYFLLKYHRFKHTLSVRFFN